MTLNRALILTTALSLATAFYFAAQAQRGAIVVQHEGCGEWIELSRGGVVVSEWQPSDGAVYEALDGALHARKDGGY